MYPYINKNSILHYFDNHGILLGKKGRQMLNDIDVYILERIDGKKSIDDIVEEISRELDADDKAKVKDIVMKCIKSKPKDILISDSPKTQSFRKSGIKEKKVPLDFVFSLTNKCNLSCSHCFKSCNMKKEDSIDFETLMKTLEFLNGKSVNIQLTGGEPMLYDRFFDVLKYAIENFNTTITTTATMINSNNIKHFKGIKCIQVSLYSHNADDHDKVTKLKGSFDRTIIGIKEAVKAGIFVSGACIVTKENMNYLEDIIRVARDSGIKLMRFGRFVPVGRGTSFKDAWCLSENDEEKVSNELSLLSGKYKDDLDIVTWSEEEKAKKIAGEDNQLDKKYKSLNCASGLYRWFISEQGFIKPCEFMPDDIYPVDNITQKDIEQILENYNLEKLAPSLKNWEKDLKKENCTLKDICPVIEDYCKKQCV